MGEHVEFVVPPECDGQRLDVFLAQALSQLVPAQGITRSGVQRMIKLGDVQLAGAIEARAAQRVTTGQLVRASLPAPEVSTALPEAIDLDVIFEDQYLLVVNKPRGMVVHPAAGHRSGTLVNAVLARCPELRREQDQEPIRPGIVHRLDRDTTGLIVVAKDAETRLKLSTLLRQRELKRTYLALVLGRLPGESGEISGAIDRSRRDRKRMAVTAVGGRAALTKWQRIAAFDGLDLLEVRLHTGRTHQIRVHMAHCGHPVAGDATYGPGTTPKLRRALAGLIGQALHAWRLEFAHPRQDVFLRLEAPPPGDFGLVLVALFRASGLRMPSWLEPIAQGHG